MGDRLSVVDEQWSSGLGIWVLCAFASQVLVQCFPPHHQFPPPSSPNSTMLLPSIATRRSPLPYGPLPLSSSPFHLHEKILILMALRLFFLFFLSFLLLLLLFFCNTTVVRWPFLHATRMQPSDRRAKSAHLHTHLHTLLHTHTLARTQATKDLISFAFIPLRGSPRPYLHHGSFPPIFIRAMQ